MAKEYRDRIYIRKDVLLKLYEYGEINQTRLMNLCGLNNVKHKAILDDMTQKGFIEKNEVSWGSKSIFKYKISIKGQDVLSSILEPYEELFPREEKK